MRNLLIVLALVFTLFSSCQKEDDVVPTGPDVEIENPIPGEDDDNEEQEEQNDNNEQNEEEEEEEEVNELCFVQEATLHGNGFEQKIIFERTALGRLETILFLKDGVANKKAEINYRSNGKIRAMAITQNGRQDLVSFTTDGLPVDKSSTFSDGRKTETKYGLDSKGRIIKEIVREGGKTIKELNLIFDGENMVKWDGFVLTSSGVEISLNRAFKYDEKGLNPMAIDPYLTYIALGKNTSKNLVVQMETSTGIQFEASYDLDQNLFPLSGSYETSTDGEMIEKFEMECL